MLTQQAEIKGQNFDVISLWQAVEQCSKSLEEIGINLSQTEVDSIKSKVLKIFSPEDSLSDVQLDSGMFDPKNMWEFNARELWQHFSNTIMWEFIKYIYSEQFYKGHK